MNIKAHYEAPVTPSLERVVIELDQWEARCIVNNATDPCGAHDRNVDVKGSCRHVLLTRLAAIVNGQPASGVGHGVTPLGGVEL